ncbi:hypothetical protein E2C01_028145 [Portunus trituberculatus]|uniref:Uncharacterized protein n=1 Tax=Portunus trituberculatus TaxID=210409 RepID=A0A5B7EQT8_PORTR|nr:hypothetical protein [Portunus trituberculatus]
MTVNLYRQHTYLPTKPLLAFTACPCPSDVMSTPHSSYTVHSIESPLMTLLASSYLKIRIFLPASLLADCGIKAAAEAAETVSLFQSALLSLQPQTVFAAARRHGNTLARRQGGTAARFNASLARWVRRNCCLACHQRHCRRAISFSSRPSLVFLADQRHSFASFAEDTHVLQHAVFALLV